MSPPLKPIENAESGWRTGLAAPLNIAAYITWLAVTLEAVDFRQLSRGEPFTLLGSGALLLVVVLYVVRASLEDRACRTATLLFLIGSQGISALLAGYLLTSGSSAILLIIVAGQIFALLPVLQATLAMTLLNAGLVWIWSFNLPVERLFLAVMPMIGFQAFAALTARYAMVANKARERHATLNAELLATQSLLDASARSSERLRLSRELHDVAGHKLTALKLNLRALRRDPTTAHRVEVQVAYALAEELLQDIRAVVTELRQHDGIDLVAALHGLVTRIPATTFVMDLDQTLRAPSVAAAQTLVRCAQEAITNAIRHGQAREIQITGRQTAHAVELHISNDGKTPEQIRFGNGLNGMRERLDESGGHLTIETRKPRGLVISAHIPV